MSTPLRRYGVTVYQGGTMGPPGPPGPGVPTGGTTGQVLSKKSATPYDTQWSTPSGGIGGGGLSVTPRKVTANYAAVTGDFVEADATAGALTVTVPIIGGTWVTVKKIDNTTNHVTVQPLTGTVEGFPTVYFTAQYASAIFIGDGTNLAVAAAYQTFTGGTGGPPPAGSVTSLLVDRFSYASTELVTATAVYTGGTAPVMSSSPAMAWTMTSNAGGVATFTATVGTIAANTTATFTATLASAAKTATALLMPSFAQTLANTGIPAGTTMQRVPDDITSGTGWSWNGSASQISITAAGANLTNLDCVGGVYSNSSFAYTATNCRFRLTGWPDASVGVYLYPGTTMTHCEIGGGGTTGSGSGNTYVRTLATSAYGTAAAPIMIDHCQIHHVTHGIHCGSYLTVQDSYIYEMAQGNPYNNGATANPNDHTDCVFFDFGQHTLFERTRFRSGNSDVFIVQNYENEPVGNGYITWDSCTFQSSRFNEGQAYGPPPNVGLGIENKDITGPLTVTNCLFDGPAPAGPYPQAVWGQGHPASVPYGTTHTGNNYLNGNAADGDFSLAAAAYATSIAQTVPVASTTTTATVTFPTAPTVGHALMFVVSYRDGATLTPPTGLTSRASFGDGAGGAAMAVYTHTAATGDGPFTFTCSTATFNVVAYELVDCNTASPIDTVVQTLAATTGTPGTGPSVVPSPGSPNGMAFEFITANNPSNISFTSQSPWASAPSVGTGVHAMWYSNTATFTAGVALNSNWVSAGTGSFAAAVLVIAPA